MAESGIHRGMLLATNIIITRMLLGFCWLIEMNFVLPAAVSAAVVAAVVVHHSW